MKKIFLGFLTSFAVLILIPSSALAQFPSSPTATPTPTLTTSPLTGGATPTATPTPASATTPAAGNATPTFVILGSSLFLLTLGVFVWRKSQRNA